MKKIEQLDSKRYLGLLSYLCNPVLFVKKGLKGFKGVNDKGV